MPCFEGNLGNITNCSENAECGKSEQDLAGYYYCLVVRLVVK